jgi:hypothetical protein
MEWLVGPLICLSRPALVALAVAGLQRLARRASNPRVERLLRVVRFALIGALLGEALPWLWPVLKPWHSLVLGASIGLAWAATRDWGGAHHTRMPGR